MATNLGITTGKLGGRLVAGLVVAWVAAAGLVGCTPQASSQGPAETPTVTAQVSPSAEPSPTPVPGPLIAPVLPPEGAEFPDAMLELLSQLELAGEPLVVSESVAIPPLCDAPGSASETTWSIARVSVGETSGDAGFCLLGSLPGTYVDNDVTAKIEAGELLGDSRVRISSMQGLSSILQDGVVTYVSNGTRSWVPVYVSFPDPQSIKDGIDESRMVPVPDFCTKDRPVLRWLVLDEGGQAFQLEGEEYLDAVYGDTEIIVELQEGEHVAMDWETGTYVSDPSHAPTEGILVGLIAPEEQLPAMVEVVAREAVEAWWQAYGERKEGRPIEVLIEEDHYLDDKGNNVKTWKITDGQGMVWARVFANVPRELSGKGDEDLVFAERIPGQLAVEYNSEEGRDRKKQVASLIANLTAEEERAGLRPILKKDDISFGSSRPRESTVKLFLWKEGLRKAQETSLDVYYEDVSELPKSLRAMKGRDFIGVLAGWLPYVEKQTLVDILEIWRHGVRNDVPMHYVDSEPVPVEYRQDWGDLPHSLVEQALDDIVETANDFALDSEQRDIFRILLNGVRSVRIRELEDGNRSPFTSSIYRHGEKAAVISFHREESTISWHRKMAEKYLQSDGNKATFQVASCLFASTIIHEACHSIFSDSASEHPEVYKRQVAWFRAAMHVFDDEFNSADQKTRDYINNSYLPSMEREAAGG